MYRRRSILFTPALLLPLRAAGQTAPAPWAPSRPVRAIVPFAPGGATDVVARVLAETVGALLGQPLVIENRPAGRPGWSARTRWRRRSRTGTPSSSTPTPT